MRRVLRAAWLVLLVVTGCETVGRVTQTQNRERELLELNQPQPRTTREREDPLQIDPRDWQEDQRSRRK